MKKYLALGLVPVILLAMGVALASAQPASPPAKDKGLQPLDYTPVYYITYQGVGDDPDDFSVWWGPGYDDTGDLYDTSNIKKSPNGQTLHDVLAFFQGYLLKRDYFKPFVMTKVVDGLYKSKGELINYEFKEDLPEGWEEYEGEKRRAVVTTWLKLDEDGQYKWKVERVDYFTRGGGKPEYFSTNIYKSGTMI